MRNYLRAILLAFCIVVVPTGLFAEGDVCSTIPVVSGGGSGEVVVEQMKERMDTLARQEIQRALWVVQMFPVKYLDSSESLKALCIFSAEIVPQQALHMISVRTSQANMSAIGDAIKRLDVPQVGPRSVELTINVLIASDQVETLRAVPASISPVVDQLRGVLSYKQFYLLDTLLGTTVDAHRIVLTGSVRGLNPAAPTGVAPDSGYQFQANLRVGNGESAAASVQLSGLYFSLGFMSQVSSINTDVNIPIGKQVVVGKATSGDRAYILVVSAKILN